MDQKLKETIRVLQDHDSFLLAGHQEPDGDCLGSEIALALLLKRWDKDVYIFNPDPPDQIYHFLPYIQWVQHTLPEQTMDVAVVVDSGDLSRTGPVTEYVRDVELLLNIDHHPESFNVGDVNLVDPQSSSVGEIVYTIYKQAGEKISREAAQLLYVSMVTDTGSFRYANTSATSHEVAAELIQLGFIDPYRIYSQLYERETFNSTRLLGHVLSNVQQEDGIVWSEVPFELFEQTGTEPRDLKNAIKYLRRIDNCQVAMLMQEREDQTVKINFRAKSDFNLLTVVKQFGGGGHEKAAGATLEGSLSDVRDRVLRTVREALPPSQAACS